MSNLKYLRAIGFIENQSNPGEFVSRIGDILLRVTDQSMLINGSVELKNLATNKLESFDHYLQLPINAGVTQENNVFTLTETADKKLSIVIQRITKSNGRGVINQVETDRLFNTFFLTFDVDKADINSRPMPSTGLLIVTDIPDTIPRNPFYEVTSTIYTAVDYNRSVDIVEIDLVAPGGVSAGDGTVRVDSNDNAAGYLGSKIVFGNGLDAVKKVVDGNTVIEVEINSVEVEEAAFGKIEKPTMLIPSDGEPAANFSDILTFSAYTPKTGFEGTHETSDWQIATDSEFTNVIYENLGDAVHLTSLFYLTDLELLPETTYYVRVNYHSGVYMSGWSVGSFTVGASYIGKPSITNPTNGSTGVTFDQTITSDKYAAFNLAEDHMSTDWQIATDSAFSNLALDMVESTTSLTSISALSEFNLDGDTTYYVRCRYHSESKASEWSDGVQFTTATIGIITPSISSPSAGSTVSRSTNIIASSYNPINQTESHINTDWQIATDNQFTNIAYESLADATNLTSIGSLESLGLASDTSYYVRVKYHSTSHESEWSVPVQFSTMVASIVTPSIVTPTDGAIDQLMSSNITSSSYSTIDHSEAHVSTDWQVATDDQFSNIVYELTENTNHLLSIGDLFDIGLTGGGDYYVRCRYHSTTYTSEWSATSTFNTSVTTVTAPTISFPPNNSTGLLLTSNITLTGYNTSNHSEPLDNTDWQIATDDQFTNMTFESMGDTVHTLTSDTFAVLGLSPGTQYYLRCRFHSEHVDGDWSSTTTFTLAQAEITKPAITSPSNNSTGVDEGSDITSSTYNTVNFSEGHVSTDWQIATDSGFTNIVYESLADTTNLTSIGDLTSLSLDLGTTYYVRVKYHSTTKESEWSTTTKFTLIVRGVEKPTITTPTNGAVNVALDSYIVSSGYTPINQTESSESSDWQIATDSDFTNITYEILNKTVEEARIGDLTTIGLSDNTSYYVRVKHRSVTYESEWSDPCNFTTVALSITTPTIIFPTNGSTDVSENVYITGDSYNAVNHSEPHESTDWQVATDSDFTNIAYEILGDTTNLTSIGKTISELGLSPASVYYTRCRYHSANVDSEWSATSQFTTVATFALVEIQELTDTSGGAVANDYLGRASIISNDGNFIFAGSGYSDVSGVGDAGKVIVYRKNSGTGVYEIIQIITAPTPTNSDHFGDSIDVTADNSRLVIGAYLDDNSRGDDYGSIFVYNWNSGTNQYDLFTTIDTSTVRRLALALTISDDKEIIVGTSILGEPGSDYHGRAIVFKYNSTTSTYDQIQVLKGDSTDDAVYDNKYGSSCTISGDHLRLMIGGDAIDNTGLDAGKVYVYDWNSVTNQYDVLQILTGPTEAYSRFGSSVTMTSDKEFVFVGAHGYDTVNGASTGAIFIFKWNSSTSQYDYVQTIVGNEATASEYGALYPYGLDVSGDGTKLVYGAYGGNVNGVTSGIAYLFTFDAGSGLYVEAQPIKPVPPTASAQFGGAVGVSDEGTILVCEPVGEKLHIFK